MMGRMKWFVLACVVVVWGMWTGMNAGRWQVVETKYAVFLLDTRSGDSWRYYRNMENGKLTAEGWQKMVME
jgi:hypothetical protein